MIDSTPSGAVVNERPARTPELVVEADAGRKTEEALQRSGRVPLDSFPEFIGDDPLIRQLFVPSVV